MLREAWEVSLPGSKGVSGFIHGVGIIPFYTIIYIEAQVMAFVETCSTANGVMHSDSTGSVFSAIVGQKRPNFYCFFNGNKKIPACEFLTRRHNDT
jgi:hypothetical protein